MAPPSLNKVTLLGRLGRDPVIRKTASGNKMAILSLGTYDPVKNEDGSYEKGTEWHEVLIVVPRLAEVVEQYCSKGSALLVEGRLQTNVYENRNGDEVVQTQVVVPFYSGNLVLLDKAGKAQAKPRRGRLYAAA